LRLITTACNGVWEGEIEMANTNPSVTDTICLVLLLLLGKQKQNFKPIIDEFGRDMTLYVEECKQRRAAEREGRRMRRRRSREVIGTHNTHHEGMSTDEEETETDSRQQKSESGNIYRSFTRFI
jgi:hypothetical protein